MADATEDTRKVRRWFRLTPDRVVLGLLALEGFLLLSQRFEWFAFNRHKGYTVLITVASVGLAMVLMFCWFLAALIFRWRFQFSIRALLLLTVVVAVPCSWLATEMKQAARQRDAIEAFHRFPQRITYDYDRPGQEIALLGCPWLRRLLGNDFFGEVVEVCLGCDEMFTDAEIAQLESLPRLEELRLRNGELATLGSGTSRDCPGLNC